MDLELDPMLRLVAREGGTLIISFDEIDVRWTVGLEWGREAEGSSMAAAASYGVGPTLEEALRTVTDEISPPGSKRRDT